MARVRKASGTVCRQTRMVARRRDRAAGSRPRGRSERLLLLFAAEKQKKEKEGGIEKGLLGLSSLIWVEVKSSRLCHGAKKQPQARVRKASGTVCRQTRMVARRRDRAAGSRPRGRSERLLLLFAAEKQKKEKEGGIEKGLLGLSSLIWVEVKSSRLCHGAKKQPQARVRKASGTVCRQTRMVARRRNRAAGSRPRERSDGFCCFSPPKS